MPGSMEYRIWGTVEVDGKRCQAMLSDTFKTKATAEASLKKYRTLYPDCFVLMEQVQIDFDEDPPVAENPELVRCFDCGTTAPDHWFTSKEGEYSLCPPCFKARKAHGRAKEV